MPPFAPAWLSWAWRIHYEVGDFQRLRDAILVDARLVIIIFILCFGLGALQLLATSLRHSTLLGPSNRWVCLPFFFEVPHPHPPHPNMQ